MSSLVALVAAHGLIYYGQGKPDQPDEAVRAVQLALSQAGYRIGVDGVFGDGTLSAVERFQRQQGLTADGKIGNATAALLDGPHAALVATAAPQTVGVQTPTGTVVFPHDDTASLIAFFGKPWEDASLLVQVPVPFALTYEGKGPITHVGFHRKAADALAAVFADLWDVYGKDQAALDATRVTKFSGTYNYRAIRGSSRLSCHAFGAAIDLDAEDLPLGKPNPSNGMPANVVACFKKQGFFWGNDYRGRKDPMHFQAAHE
jgi:peptidoglycan hydrolase-like protein with peptidoglycan-binding domain